MNNSLEQVRGVCPHDCPDSCSWLVTVDRRSGRAVGIRPDPRQPFTGKQLCVKVNRYLENRVYHPDRLTQPKRRINDKADGSRPRYETISWKEAISTIVDRLGKIIATHGPESILPYSYGGTMGVLQGEAIAEAFFSRLGSTQLARTICAEAGATGYRYTIGSGIGMDPTDFIHSKIVLLWGCNALTSNVHLWKIIQQAKKSGSQIIVIDPVRTKTARAASRWIPIRPGTDGALAMALMAEIVHADRHDGDYVSKHTLGFTQLCERLRSWNSERGAEITGIPAPIIRELALAIASTPATAIRINYGMQRCAGGGMATRAIVCIPALTGSWKVPGGGVLLSTSGVLPLDPTCLPGAAAANADTIPRRKINMIRLGDALSLNSSDIARAHHHPRPVDRRVDASHAGPPIHGLIVYNSNPAAVAPDQGAVRRGLARADLFTVVLEHFQTDTADYADIVLPATSQLEHWDILRPYGHFYLTLNRPAIEPVGESLPNSEIFRRIARGMGFRDSCFLQDDETQLRQIVAGQRHPNFSSITWETLIEQGFVRAAVPSPFLPHSNGDFSTPSGKCEFYSNQMAEDGYDPVPTYIPPNSLTNPYQVSSNNKASLQCVTPPAHHFLNSSFANVEKNLRAERTPKICMHPQDIFAHNLADGAQVEVRSATGSLVLRLESDDGLIEGTAMIPSIWWSKLSPTGTSVNILRSQQETDMGGSALFHDLSIRVSLATGPDSTP